MVEILESQGCCGMDELVGIEHSTPAETIKDVLERYLNDGETDVPLFVYSGVAKDTKSKRANHAHGGYGEALTAYIKKHKLGTVVVSKAGINPNTGNKIKAWIWTVNNKKMLAYAKAKGIKADSDYDDDYDSDWNW
mgnify:CR=1 FL=1